MRGRGGEGVWSRAPRLSCGPAVCVHASGACCVCTCPSCMLVSCKRHACNLAAWRCVSSRAHLANPTTPRCTSSWTIVWTSFRLSSAALFLRERDTMSSTCDFPGSEIRLGNEAIMEEAIDEARRPGLRASSLRTLEQLESVPSPMLFRQRFQSSFRAEACLRTGLCVMEARPTRRGRGRVVSVARLKNKKRYFAKHVPFPTVERRAAWRLVHGWNAGRLSVSATRG